MSMTSAVKLAGCEIPSLSAAVRRAAREEAGDTVVRFPQPQREEREDSRPARRGPTIALLLGVDTGAGRTFSTGREPQAKPRSIVIEGRPPARRRAMGILGLLGRLAFVAVLLAALHLFGATGTGSEAQVRGSFVPSKRVALVIGNAAYMHTHKLENPRNDAADLSAALRKAGFHVVEGYDLDKVAFDRKIREFAAALSGAESALFFYAGHGLQVAGANYLVPIDAQLTTTSALDFEMVRLDLVHRTMEREAETNILFVDACRDNPLSRNLARAMGTRSAEIGRGLAPVESGIGTLISFSTQPGNVALDGSGRNSPFTRALLRQLSSSSDDLSAMLISVRNEVVKDTARKQVPWEHSALTGRFYFKPPPKAPAAVSSGVQALSEAAEVWTAIQHTSSIAVLETFIARFAETPFAALAQARLQELRRP
jgi:uncharacterized caspase-like protein